MKIPIDGGAAELLKAGAIANGYLIGALNFSPDGRWMPELASISNATTQTSSRTIALVDVNADSAASAKYLEPRANITIPIAFTPDGKAVAYSTVENGVGNIWAQLLDGSPGRWLTSFTSDRIATFQFSPDGKSLAVSRVHIISDVVLLRDTPPSSK